jgi:hypothetical protein
MNEEEQDFGPRLGRILEGYARELPSPPSDLVSAGMARGRRLRRRRQSLWGAAGLTLTAGLVGGAVLGGVLPGGGADDTTAKGTARDSGTAVTIPDFSLAAAQTSAPAGKTALTGKTSVAILRDLLPGDPTTSGYQWWDGAQGGDAKGSGAKGSEAKEGDRPVQAGGRLLMAVGGGQAEVTVSVEGSFQLTTFDALSKDAAREAAGDQQDKRKNAAPDKSAAARDAAGQQDPAEGEEGKKLRPVTKAQLQDFYSCQARRESGVRQTACVARNLDDGSVEISYEEKSGSLVRRTSDVLRGDGTRIVVTVSNSSDSKRGPAEAASPPLTMAQVTDTATSARWQPWVSPSVIEGAKGLS